MQNLFLLFFWFLLIQSRDMRYRKGGDQVNYSYLTLCVLSLCTIRWVYKLVWRKLLNAVVSLVSSLIAILKVFKRLVTSLLNEWRRQRFLKDRPVIILSGSFFCLPRKSLYFVWKDNEIRKKTQLIFSERSMGHWLVIDY